MKLRYLAIVVLSILFLSSCYNGMMFGVDYHESLAAGVYSSIDDNTRYVLEIGAGDHTSDSGSTAILDIYNKAADGAWEESPAYTYTGTYKHYKTEYYEGYPYYELFSGIPRYYYRHGEIVYHIDELKFTEFKEGSVVVDDQAALDEVSGKLGFIINPDTAYITDRYGRQCYWQDFGYSIRIQCTPLTKTEIRSTRYTGSGADPTVLSQKYWTIETLVQTNNGT